MERHTLKDGQKFQIVFIYYIIFLFWTPSVFLVLTVSGAAGYFSTFSVHTAETVCVTLVSFRQTHMSIFSTPCLLPLGINLWTKESGAGRKHRQNHNGTVFSKLSNTANINIELIMTGEYKGTSLKFE